MRQVRGETVIAKLARSFRSSASGLAERRGTVAFREAHGNRHVATPATRAARDSAIVRRHQVFCESAALDFGEYDERRVSNRSLSPIGPAVIWGALMTLAVFAAGATVWTSRSAPEERLVASSDTELRRNVRELASQRDEFADRVARLERGLGEVRLAAQASAQSEVTGSITARPAPAPAPAPGPQAFGLDLGPDLTIEAVQRRWLALSNRNPQLARLAPRARRTKAGDGLDLIAGPFQTASDAARACSSLADQGFACDTTTYAGEPLPRR